MNVLHVRYLLAGGGVASVAAAEAIRLIDPEGSMLMVGQEVHRAYHRPILSRDYLRRPSSRKNLYVHGPHWLVEHRIDLRTGQRIARLDPPRSAAVLSTGEEVTYDKLLIATGASAAPLNIPGAQLPNLFYLRTLDDAERLKNAIDKALKEGKAHAKGRGRAVIIGAGLLGVELASTFGELGIAVDLVASREHPWSKYAGDVTGRFLASLLSRHGVTLHAGRHPLRLEGDGRVQRVILDDAPSTTLDCDLAIACVGAVANKDLLRNTTISAGKAILVDAMGQTSIPNIYAAGDCSAILDPRFGKHRWLEHWDGAMATAALAGRNMAGAHEPFAALSGFDSDVFGVRLKAWGEPRLVDRRIIRGTPNADAPAFAEIGVAKDGRVAQVLIVGAVAEAEALRQMVFDRTDVTGREEALRDPSINLA